MRRLSHFLCALICLLFSHLHAQESLFSDSRFGATGHAGFMIAHHATMKYLVKGHIRGGELNWSMPTFGKEQWERDYYYPEYGVSVMYLDLSNPNVLGNLYGGFAFMNFPSAFKERSVRLNFRLGFGVAYISRAFDRLENHKNIAIGSHLNALIDLRFNSSIRVAKHLLIQPGIGLTHASNGSSRVPNLGINMPTLSIGLAYDLSAGTRQRIRDTILPVEKKLHFHLVAGSGWTQIEPAGGKNYFIGSLSGNLAWPLNNRWRLISGLDLIYNAANLEKLHRDTIPVANDLVNLQSGVKAGGELFIGKVSIPLEMGVYMYTKMVRNGSIYHRFGLRYHWNERWLAGIALKTHFAKADYFEWNVGYRLGR